MLLELKEIKTKDLIDCEEYFVTIEGHPPLTRAVYTEQDNGNMWMFADDDRVGFILTPEDEIYEIPESLMKGQR